MDINNCNFTGSSNGNGIADRDIYCGCGEESSTSVHGSNNTSDKDTPYRYGLDKYACDTLFN